jgi:hypothetical protein
MFRDTARRRGIGGRNIWRTTGTRDFLLVNTQRIGKFLRLVIHACFRTDIFAVSFSDESSNACAGHPNALSLEVLLNHGTI